jgi:hypothetical protein
VTEKWEAILSKFIYDRISFTITKCGGGLKWSEVYEELRDIKGVIIIRISKRNRQHNGQKKKDKRTNNDLQNIHIKLKIE